MPLFNTLTTERICQEIDAAKKHVILASPGVSVSVAKALQHANQRLGKGAIQVVLDVSFQQEDVAAKAGTAMS